MKIRAVIRIAVVISVMLLCTGFGVYSFLRLHKVKGQQEFDLYSLVPQSAVAVVETDCMDELVADLNALKCSQAHTFLHISDLFTYLKKYLTSIAEEAPHGLSPQMNRMLLSFHTPDNALNQVFYCGLGSGDQELVEAFVRKYTSSRFPSKRFTYRGEEIHIYAMDDDRFLAAYVAPEFTVLSFQKRLIEQVIDARRDKKSLMQSGAFRAMRTDKRHHVEVRTYLRTREVALGNAEDSLRSERDFGKWMDFDIKLKEEAIYASGVSHAVDSTQTLIHAISRQRPVGGFMGDRLPASTFYYMHWAFSEKDILKQTDEVWGEYLREFSGDDILSCYFSHTEADTLRPCAVTSVPVADVAAAERRLRILLYPSDWQERKYKRYHLPASKVLNRLTGLRDSTCATAATFYAGHLLLASDAVSLSAYIKAIERGEVIEHNLLFEEGVQSLSPTYNYLMMVDMDMLLKQPNSYLRLMPNFFLRHAGFFRHFMMAIQVTCTDGVLYPNIVLIYKGGGVGGGAL